MKISIFPAITLTGNIPSKMILPNKRIIILLLILFAFDTAIFSQSYSSRNNYTGAWETPASWTPTWTTPQTNVLLQNITINGYITANESLSFSVLGQLTINDTLVIKGDLTIDNSNKLRIGDQGILIVWGNLTIIDNAQIEENGYIIVTGNINKTGATNLGQFKSNDNPVKVFIGGTIPSELTNDNSDYRALNCAIPNTIPYPNSGCSYGNLTDLINDPIYPFFQITCSLSTPTITAGGPTSFCAGGSVTLTSSAGSAYLWSNGATTQSVNITSSGSYSVRVTSAGGCQSAASVATVVTVNELPSTPVITAGGPTTFCQGGSVNLTSTAGNSYLWSTGATTSNINITSSGSYTVRITNSNGCQSAVSATTSVTVNSLPATPNITASGPTTFCSGGSLTLTSSPETAYLWSNGATTNSINATSSGNYSVRVTNSNGCQSPSSTATTVVVNSLPVTPAITTGGPTTFCAGGSVTLTSSAGSGYLWSTGATTPSINVTSSGNYSVQITDAPGCQSASSAATKVTVNAIPVTPVITTDGPTTFCAGGKVILTSSSETSYLWSNGATTHSINVTTPGNYSVIGTSSDGCQSASSTAAVVSINPLPIVNAGSDVTIPNGTGTTINATVTGDGPFAYNWSPSIFLVNPDVEDPTTVNLPSTTVFTLTATSLTTSCSNSDKVTISVSGGPLGSTPEAIPGTVCSGEDVQLYAIASGGSGSYTYTWSSIPAGFSSSVANPIVNPTLSTTYNVAVFDGFNTVNSQVVVTVNSLPSTPSITPDGPTTFCNGSNVTLTSDAGTTYLWSTGESTQSINVSTSGIYSVQVTNSGGCLSTPSASTVVTVNSLPATPSVTADGPTIFCEGGSVTLTASAGSAYLWSNGATSQSINVNSSGSYSVRVTSAEGCQSAASPAIIVTVNALPATPAITATGPTTFCQGGSVSLTSSTGNSYFWSTGENTANIDIISSGSYTVRISDANGCQSSISAATTVTVNSLPATPNISADGPTTFCSGGSVTLTSSPETGYLWSNGATTNNIEVTSSGNFSVIVTDANGCNSLSSAATPVLVNASPVTPAITADGPTTFCAGGNVTLTSGTGSNYLWSDGEITQSIVVTSSGSYTVQITDTEGCPSELSVATIVTVNTLPATAVITADGPTTFCSGGSVTLTTVGGSNYLWSTGSIAPDIIVSSTGNYSVQLTDANGCSSALSIATEVTVNALPVVNITSSNSSLCIGDQRILAGDPAGGNFYVSDGPGTITGNVLSATGSGNINLEYIYSDICTNKATQTIVADEKAAAYAGPDQTLSYVFDTQMEAELPQYGTGEWSLVTGSGNIEDKQSPTTRITGLSIGENKFIWKVHNGSCESTDEVAVTVNDIVTPTVITPNNDGLNDELIFPGLIAFPGSTMIIYNRWGSEVYRSSDYKNDWNGKDTKHRDLQADTYFYILKISNGRILKGFIEIRR
jgi:large repetitive protein